MVARKTATTGGDPTPESPVNQDEGITVNGGAAAAAASISPFTASSSVVTLASTGTPGSSPSPLPEDTVAALGIDPLSVEYRFAVAADWASLFSLASPDTAAGSGSPPQIRFPLSVSSAEQRSLCLAFESALTQDTWISGTAR